MLDYSRRVGLGVAVGATGGVYATPYLGRYGYGPSTLCYSPAYRSPWGYSYYDSHYRFAFGLTFNLGGPCNPFWWGPYVSCWYPYWYYAYRPTQVVIVSQPEPASVVYVQGNAPAARYVGNAAALEDALLPEVELRPGEPLSIAAQRYLTLGDRAFREGRYSDAVQLYAKAIRYGGEEGGLFLLLGDALFAVGDYRYGADAIRRALELDPLLVEVPTDKHAFYDDPAQFDHQLEVLEGYLKDHPDDDSARILLALNQLFGTRPDRCVELLESDEARSMRSDPIAALILEAALAR